MKKLDLIGKTFERLTVISECGKWKSRPLWLCRCSCGNEVKLISHRLTSGNTRSCGCLHREGFRKIVTKHGMRGCKEYTAWYCMVQRCLNPNNQKFYMYGGRGIKVCRRWIESFEDFYADMGAKPSLQHSIDRIDNAKGYSPENCRWATRLEQAANTRRNRHIVFNGKSQTLSGWAREIGLGVSSLAERLEKMSIIDALTTPPKKTEKIAFRGESLTRKEWSESLGIAYTTVVSRLNKLPTEKALDRTAIRGR